MFAGSLKSFVCVYRSSVLPTLDKIGLYIGVVVPLSNLHFGLVFNCSRKMSLFEGDVAGYTDDGIVSNLAFC